MRLLLLSNSTNTGESYLGFSKKEVKNFLTPVPDNIIFIPYAAVTFSYDEYEKKVNEAWEELGIQVISIHHFPDVQIAIENAGAIVIGGGNTWKLVHLLHEKGLMEVVRERVQAGVSYIGWSAGSNVACPTLKTTNDMPITEPGSFNTLRLVPFQINPHYLDVTSDNHAGETREYRIQEFIMENRHIYVVGLREGTLLKLVDERMCLLGEKTARIFKYQKLPVEVSSREDLSFLL